MCCNCCVDVAPLIIENVTTLFLENKTVTKVTSEELSQFYKEFLDNKYSEHMKYNRYVWMLVGFKLFTINYLFQRLVEVNKQAHFFHIKNSTPSDTTNFYIKYYGIHWQLYKCQHYDTLTCKYTHHALDDIVGLKVVQS